MAQHFTEEELNKLNKQAIIMLFLSMQDQLREMNDSINRLTEQIAASNQYRFGRRSEKLDVLDGQMSLFDFFNEAESAHDSDPSKEEPEPEKVVTTRKKPKGKRRSDLKDLPVIVITHEVSEERLHEDPRR